MYNYIYNLIRSKIKVNRRWENDLY